mgnify:CR=1 FL=1
MERWRERVVARIVRRSRLSGLQPKPSLRLLPKQKPSEPPGSKEPRRDVPKTYRSGRRGRSEHATLLPGGAFFHHAEAGYTFDAGWKPRLALQFDYASGDASGTDGENNRGRNLAEFKAAYAASPVYKILNNLGLCAMKLERNGEALEAYGKYLAQGKNIDEAEKKQIQSDMEIMTRGSSPVSIW